MTLVTQERYRGVLTGAVGTEIVRVVYSDETERGPITVIAALVMNMDEHWPKIESALAAIKADTPQALLYEGKELKGTILHGKVRRGAWQQSNGQKVDPECEKAREILLRVLEVPIKYPTPIFYGAVDNLGYDKYLETRTRGDFLRARVGIEAIAEVSLKIVGIKTTAHDIAFDQCLAKVNAAAQSFLPKDEQILWIHDHRGSREQEFQTEEGLHWTRFLAEEGWDPLNLSHVGKQEVHIADSIYFGDSHKSLALQLADICCSTIGLKLLQTLYGDKQWYALPFYAAIQRRIMNDGAPPLFMELAKRNDKATDS